MRIAWLVVAVFFFVGGDLCVPPVSSGAEEGPHMGGPLQGEDPVKDAEATRQRLLANRLSIDLRGVPLSDALEMLASAAGVGLAIDGHIKGEALREPIDVRLEKASAWAVLHWVFLKRDLTWAVRGRDVLVAPLRFIEPDVVARQNEFLERTEDEWEATARPKLTGTKISMDLSEVPIEHVLRVIAERVGMSVVWTTDAEPSRRHPISINFADITLADLLDKLAVLADLHWGLEAEAIVLSPK